MTVWFVSDTHFRHPFVASLRGFVKDGELDSQGRPLGDRDAHDEALVTNWNAVVRKDDLVWHLGDVGIGRPRDILPYVYRLNGRKQLIAGNHDPVHPSHRDARRFQKEYLEVFESVQPFARTGLDGREVLLSHFPYQGAGDHTDEERGTQWRLPDEGRWLIHGHVHSKERLDGYRSVHAGLDAWGLAPVSDLDIAMIVRKVHEEEDGE